MKIQFVSDLHLEFEKPEVVSGRPEFSLENHTGADVLVLAGDITTAKSYQSHEDFFRRCSDNWKDVVYVLGNHEFYRGDIEETQAELFEFLYRRFKNIHLLDNDRVVRNGICFYGCTLWTDCNQNDPITKLSLQNSMTDYHIIQYISKQQRRLRPDDTREIHEKSLGFLRDHLENSKDLKTIVVTHHGPSRRSIHSRYAQDYHMNGGFVSSLEDQFLGHGYNIPLWFHGHVHNSFDYNIGGTRVLTNPKGYPVQGRDGQWYNENEDFDPNKTVEII